MKERERSSNFGHTIRYTASGIISRQMTGNFQEMKVVWQSGHWSLLKKCRIILEKENVIPIYIQVDDGVRLERALERERTQKEPKYAELCRRFLADEKDFSEENLERLGIVQRFENLDMGKCTNEIMLYIQKNLCYNNNKETGSI